MLQSVQNFDLKFDALLGGNPVKQDEPNNILFEGLLNGVQKAKSTQEVAKTEMQQVLLGNSDNAHNALIMLETANLQMQFMRTAGDKVTQGINQMLNMQV